MDSITKIALLIAREEPCVPAPSEDILIAVSITSDPEELSTLLLGNEDKLDRALGIVASLRRESFRKTLSPLLKLFFWFLTSWLFTASLVSTLYFYQGIFHLLAIFLCTSFASSFGEIITDDVYASYISDAAYLETPWKCDSKRLVTKTGRVLLKNFLQDAKT